MTHWGGSCLSASSAVSWDAVVCCAALYQTPDPHLTRGLSDNQNYAAIMLRQAKPLEAGVCAEVAPPFAMSREARDEGADDMDMDGVSLSASDREGDDGGAASAEQQSEALGRGRRNLARSRSRGESDDEADLGAPLSLCTLSPLVFFALNKPSYLCWCWL